MRFFEILIFFTTFAALLLKLFSKKLDSKVRIYLPFSIGLLIPLHLCIEKYRWQMLPIIIFVLVFIITHFLQLKLNKNHSRLIKNKILRIIIIVLIFLIFIASLIFPVLLPVVDLPTPSGPFDVGKTNFRLTDIDREELFTEVDNDYRNILVTAWYPMETRTGKTKATYWDQDNEIGKYYSLSAEIGTFWYSHLSLVQTNSFIDAQISQHNETYPLIIYSSSYNSLHNENTMLMEELASQGYIVFSISHAYESIVTDYPNGEIVTSNLDYVSELYDSHAEEEDELYKQYDAAENSSEKERIVAQILVVDEFLNQLLKVRTQDVILVLDQLKVLNEENKIFDGKINTDNIGIIGWSLGGACVTESCIADERLSACVNIDGWPYGELFNSDAKINQPYLLVLNDSSDETDIIVSNMISDKVENNFYSLIIKNAEHTNFWDFPLFFKIYKYLDYWGFVDPIKMLEINQDYIVGFFDHYIKGNTSIFPEKLLEKQQDDSVIFNKQ